MAITKIQSESLNLADTYAFTGTVTGAGGVNTPAFQAVMTGVSTSFSEATLNAITSFNSEDFDTDNAFDPSTGKFTPQTAGKYYAETQVHLNGNGNASDLYMAYVQIYKNDAPSRRTIQQHDQRNNGGWGFGLITAGVFSLNGSTDFLKVMASINTVSNSAGTLAGETNYTYFRAYRIIE